MGCQLMVETVAETCDQCIALHTGLCSSFEIYVPLTPYWCQCSSQLRALVLLGVHEHTWNPVSADTGATQA